MAPWRIVLLLHAVAFMGGLRAQTPRLIEPRLFAGFASGLTVSSLTADSGAAFHQIPWFTIAGDVGASFTYRERLCLALQGSYSYNGAYFYRKDMEYRVYHRIYRTEARISWQKRYRDYDDRMLRLGLGVGMDIQGNGWAQKDEGDFRARSDALALHRVYLAPEVTMFMQDGVEVGLRYLWHPDRTPAMYTTLTLPDAATHSTTTHDQLAVVVRYHFTFPRKQREPPAPPAVDYATRKMDTLTTLYATYRTIELELWDNAEFDGDTVSILLNGTPVVSGMELSTKHQRVLLDLSPGANEILLVANNEGRVPPNTALCRVRRVKGRPLLSVHTSARTNQLVRVMLDP